MRYLQRQFVFRVLLIILTIGTASGGHCQEKRFEVPELTVRVSPAKPYVQEQLIHSVRIVSTYDFAELNVDIPDVSGADTIIVTQPSVRVLLSYGTEGFVYETNRVLFAKSSGTLKIPGVHVTGATVVGDEEITFERRSDDIEIDIAPIPTTYEGSSWLVSGLIQIREEYSTPFEQLRVGDTVRRTINVNAKGTTGEHIPQLEMRPSRGLTILPGTPSRRTEKSAGGVTGFLTQSFDLRIEENQPMDFGPVRLIWWDSEADAGRRSAAPAIRIEPLPRDVRKLTEELMDEAKIRQRNSRVGTIGIAGTIIGLLVITWFGLKTRRRTPQDRQLLAVASTSPSNVNAVVALMAWAKATSPKDSVSSITDIADRLGTDLAPRLQRLSDAAFKEHSDPVDFAELAREIVKRQRKVTAQGTTRTAALLDLLLGQKSSLPNLDHS